MKIDVALEAWEANPKIEAVISSPPGVEPIAYRFVLPGRSEVISALVTDAGNKIDLQPERSASHRALRDALQS